MIILIKFSDWKQNLFGFAHFVRGDLMETTRFAVVARWTWKLAELKTEVDIHRNLPHSVSRCREFDTRLSGSLSAVDKRTGQFKLDEGWIASWGT